MTEKEKYLETISEINNFKQDFVKRLELIINSSDDFDDYVIDFFREYGTIFESCMYVYLRNDETSFSELITIADSLALINEEWRTTSYVNRLLIDNIVYSYVKAILSADKNNVSIALAKLQKYIQNSFFIEYMNDGKEYIFNNIYQYDFYYEPFKDCPPVFQLNRSYWAAIFADWYLCRLLSKKNISITSNYDQRQNILRDKILSKEGTERMGITVLKRLWHEYKTKTLSCPERCPKELISYTDEVILFPNDIKHTIEHIETYDRYDPMEDIVPYRDYGCMTNEMIEENLGLIIKIKEVYSPGDDKEIDWSII